MGKTVAAKTQKKAPDEVNLLDSVVSSFTNARLFNSQYTFRSRQDFCQAWDALITHVKATVYTFRTHSLPPEPGRRAWLDALKSTARPSMYFRPEVTLSVALHRFVRSSQSCLLEVAPHLPGAQWTINEAKRNQWRNLYSFQARRLLIDSMLSLQVFNSITEPATLAFDRCIALERESYLSLLELYALEPDPDTRALIAHNTLGSESLQVAIGTFESEFAPRGIQSCKQIEAWRKLLKERLAKGEPQE